MAKLSLLLCCLQDGENNLPSTLFKLYTEFNKKCACTNKTAARNLCSERLGVLCYGLSLNCFPVVCYETHRLIQKRWDSAKKFLF